LRVHSSILEFMGGAHTPDLPYAATPANVTQLREEAASLLRAAAQSPEERTRSEIATEVDAMADRLERSLGNP
jgi:hypothetical protein